MGENALNTKGFLPPGAQKERLPILYQNQESFLAGEEGPERPAFRTLLLAVLIIWDFVAARRKPSFGQQKKKARQKTSFFL